MAVWLRLQSSGIRLQQQCISATRVFSTGAFQDKPRTVDDLPHASFVTLLYRLLFQGFYSRMHELQVDQAAHTALYDLCVWKFERLKQPCIVNFTCIQKGCMFWFIPPQISWLNWLIRVCITGIVECVDSVARLHFFPVTVQTENVTLVVSPSETIENVQITVAFY